MVAWRVPFGSSGGESAEYHKDIFHENVKDTG